MSQAPQGGAAGRAATICDEADDDELLYEKEGRKMELRPKDAGQSSGIRLQHFQEEFVHHDTAVFLEVKPELLGQQLDVGDGGQQQEELAQAAGLTPVTRLDAVDQRILQLVLKTPHRLTRLQPHVCNHHNHTNNRQWRQPHLFLHFSFYTFLCLYVHLRVLTKFPSYKRPPLTSSLSPPPSYHPTHKKGGLTNVAEDDGLEEDVLFTTDAQVGELLAQLARQAVQLGRDVVGLHHLGGHTQVLGIADGAVVGTGAEDKVEAEDLQPRVLQ